MDVTSATAVELGAATDVGRVRAANEDAILAALPDSGAHHAPGDVLVAVADGMGGHNAGEVASALAVQALQEALRQPLNGTLDTSQESRLRTAVLHANRRVWEAASVERGTDGMGTTLVCALVRAGGEVAIANVGDSRAYLVSADDALLVTEDHSWVQEQVRAGRMSERDARTSPYRNVLSRSLGVGPDVEVDLYADVALRQGDALVLCSDGVSGYLEPPDLVLAMRESASAQELAERLVYLAVDRGGADNASVVVARVTP